MAEMTYVALKPLTIRGSKRQPGELVPEAVEWHNVGAYISTGRIAAVPKDSVDTEALEAAESEWAQAVEEAHKAREEPETDETPDQEASGAEETSESAVEAPEVEETDTQDETFDYYDLNIDEVVDRVEDGTLTTDEVLEYELNRPGDKGPRQGVLDYLDSLENGEADEEG